MKSKKKQPNIVLLDRYSSGISYFIVDWISRQSKSNNLSILYNEININTEKETASTEERSNY